MSHPGEQLPPVQTWPALHAPFCQVPVASHVAGAPPVHRVAPGVHIPVHAPSVHAKGHVICLVNVCPSAQTSTDPVLSHSAALGVHPPDVWNWMLCDPLHPNAAQRQKSTPRSESWTMRRVTEASTSPRRLYGRRKSVEGPVLQAKNYGDVGTGRRGDRVRHAPEPGSARLRLPLAPRHAVVADVPVERPAPLRGAR